MRCYMRTARNRTAQCISFCRLIAVPCPVPSEASWWVWGRFRRFVRKTTSRGGLPWRRGRRSLLVWRQICPINAALPPTWKYKQNLYRHELQCKGVVAILADGRPLLKQRPPAMISSSIARCVTFLWGP